MSNKEAARKDLHMNLASYDSIYTFADRIMITTVVQNLISNAIHFTPPSGKITIQCQRNEQYAEVIVSDNGIGIAEEDIPRLFDYDMLKNKIGSGDNKGAGLGLILCKEMLQRNGGDIRVKSIPGKGSEFSFLLPLSEINGSESNTGSSDVNEAGKFTDDLLSQVNIPESAVVSDILLHVAPKFQEVTEVLSLENIGYFADSVSKAGEKHHIDPLVRYGSTLRELLKMHRIDQILKLLPQFKAYLTELEIKT
jgi:hypothetical protein